MDLARPEGFEPPTMANYKWKKTKYKGLEYREHATRKHGIKKVKFYRFRFQINGVRILSCSSN
jgi:hypothetical protein